MTTTGNSLLATVRAAARQPEKEGAMNYAEITLDLLRQNRPDLVAAIETAHNITAQLAAARTEGDAAGRTAERERLAGIDKIAPKGMEKLAGELKADPTITPEKAAMRFLEAQNAIAAGKLQGVKDAEQLVTGINAAPTTGAAAGAGGGAQPKYEQNETGWKAEFAAGGTGFVSEADYVAFKKQEAAGNVRILGRKTA